MLAKAQYQLNMAILILKLTEYTPKYENESGRLSTREELMAVCGDTQRYARNIYAVISLGL